MEWNNISMQKLQMIYRDFYFLIVSEASKE